VDYLTSLNVDVDDTLTVPGPDAVLHTAAGDVALEVTTLNADVGHWILTERLTEQFENSGFIADKRIKITYSFERVRAESNGDIYRYVAKIAEAIRCDDAAAASELSIAFKVSRGPGAIVWDQNLPASPADPAYPKIPWLKMLTEDVLDRISERSKHQQLTTSTRALLFVGVNSLPVIWPFPEIFQRIANTDSPDQLVLQLETFWRTALANHPSLVGVCYFVYSLEQETPYYPLRIFWRRDDDRIAIRV
jgi:hypothetical protein